MALPRLFALIVGLLAAAYFGFGLAQYTVSPIVAGIMLFAALILVAASPRRAVTRLQRNLVVAAWGVFSLLSIAALIVLLLMGGDNRVKAMALLLFLTGFGFTVRSAWQAGKKKRRKWDNYFDK